ncbi:MAG: hypothetical protein ACRD1C_01595 [Terriglobales bacterium]
MSPLRLALPDSLRAVVSPLRWSGEPPQLFSPLVPSDERERTRWQRLWRERRGASGASTAEAEEALQNGSVRALLSVLDRQADAALLEESESAPARCLLEPRRGFTCADLWITGAPDDSAAVFGWWSGDLDPVSWAADQVRAAVDELARLAGRPALAVVVAFAGGADAGRSARERFAATLAARVPVRSLSLYSPLFFRNGELLVPALLAAIRLQTGAALPLLCVPRLAQADVSAALLSSGSVLAGPLSAGAEVPVARLGRHATPAHAQATCAWLTRGAVQAPVAALGRIK